MNASQTTADVSVVGLGRVGLPLALSFADRGLNVVGIDNDPGRLRSVREGRMPFDRWGEKTDGGAPWMEWKDLDKLLRLLAPRQFEVVLALEFHNSDFNWFDLLAVD